MEKKVYESGIITFKLPTIYEGVYVEGALTESNSLHIQVRDNLVDDSLATTFIEIPMNEVTAIKCLQSIQESLTKTVIENLWIKWVFKQYGFEKTAGNYKDFNSFMNDFQHYMNLRVENYRKQKHNMKKIG